MTSGCFYHVGIFEMLHPAETRFVKLGSRVLLKYGYASPWRYYMQARALVWMILRYRSYCDVVTYMYKWFKVIFFFDNKYDYVRQMIKGSKEGISLWREEAKRSKNI